MLEGKRVVVTGGTGSMGRVLVRRLLKGVLGTPAKVIVFSRDEAKQHYMRQDYLNRTVTTDEVIYRNFQQLLEFRIGDVRDYASIAAVLRDADVVVNAAALKQVPICEYFPDQALMTNCLGPQNIIRAIVEMRLPIETVVGISTDKAVLPINVMGMTKAIQERIFIAGNIHAPRTRFICVRYGNVMASRGSVIPLFRQQILSGSPVTITTADMTRFLLTIEDAVDTVMAALQNAKAGEIFVPVAVSALITDVAKAMVGDRKNKIQITGIRPGEKIHETLISQEECRRVARRGNYYAIRSMLPEIQPDTSELSALNKPFTSADDPIGYKQAFELLERNNMLVHQSGSEFDAPH